MVRGGSLGDPRSYAEDVPIGELGRRTGPDRKTIPPILRAESPSKRPAPCRRESKLEPFWECVLRRMELGVLSAVGIHAVPAVSGTWCLALGV